MNSPEFIPQIPTPQPATSASNPLTIAYERNDGDVSFRTPPFRTPKEAEPESLSPVNTDFNPVRSRVRLTNRNLETHQNNPLVNTSEEQEVVGPSEEHPGVMLNSPRTSRPGLRPRSILKTLKSPSS